MTIQVRFFGSLSESVGETIEIELADAPTVGDLRARCAEMHAGAASVLSTCMVAVNTEFAEDATALSAGDEIAFLPPVSGG